MTTIPHVLLITYMFPPAGGIGVPRALGFSRYLPRNGCRLSVLTPANSALRDKDPKLGELVPADVSVYRAWSPEPPMSLRDRFVPANRATPVNGTNLRPPTARRFSTVLRALAHRVLFPDPQTVWLPWAWRKVCRIVQEQAVDTVVITMPPFSFLKLAISLKQTFPKLNLILDFRDEWLEYYLPNIERAPKEKISRAAILEKKAVEAATYISAVTGTWVNNLRTRYPEQPRAKFICVPNGYEPDMFGTRASRPRAKAEEPRMIVTYLGTIHDNRIYSPDNYLAAIDNLPEGIRDQVETRFVGRVIGDAQRSFQSTKARVKLLGFLPKSEAIRMLRETDFALVIATDPGSHAGKLFDYLGCGKPILALSPPGGEIDALLQRTRMGWCADPWDQSAIEQMLLSAYWRLKQGGPIINADAAAVREYSWPSIIRNFALATGLSSDSQFGVAEQYLKAGA